MEITEEQRRRAEANRVAALAKRSQSHSANMGIWNLFKCRKTLNPSLPESDSVQEKPLDVVPKSPGFTAVLEICESDGFSIFVQPVEGSKFPGESECYRIIEARLSNVAPLRVIETPTGGSTPVYMLKEYDLVLKCLKKLPLLHLQEIPWKTLAVVQKFSHAFIADKWIACMPGHLSDGEVDALLQMLPKKLQVSLLPFQQDGVKFGLRRGGRCLIADEMGLGKTVQAIAIAACFMNEGPILVVCPAVLRFPWAEELESWLPFCAPKDIHLVFGHQDNVAYLTSCPKIVVISYTMLHRLRKTMQERDWAVMIIDESHNVRCTKKKIESDETQAVLDLATKVKRIILLSGTPSLSRPFDIFHQINMLWPGLLGKDKYEFAKNYCSQTVSQGYQGKKFKDFSKGIRLQELNVLLKNTVMIRRLKEDVSLQLPPKRRQVIRLILRESSLSTPEVCGSCDLHGPARVPESELGMHPCNSQVNTDAVGRIPSSDISSYRKKLRQLSYQEIGIAKLPRFREWISNHSIVTELGDNSCSSNHSQKMIIFGHHLKVLDGIQEIVCQNHIEFVRIDGCTLPKERQAAVQSFRSRPEVRIAIIGITAGGVGLDFSSAQNVVFLELPKTASEMLQAEDRAHRRGQTNSVNIYIFCAKDTEDEVHWQQLNKSLHRVTTMVNGKDGMIEEIEVDMVHDLGASPHSSISGCPRLNTSWISKLASSVLASNGLGKCDDDYENKHDLGNYVDQHAEDKVDVLNAPSFSNEHNGGEGAASNEAEKAASIPADSLRFEVSQNTGRIHLYACGKGKDLRPRLLCENFRLEEIELQVQPSLETDNGTVERSIIHNPEYRGQILTFIKEWSDLRPIERNKLHGKPLQLPLSMELWFLKEASNYGPEGLLKGRSTRRTTPFDEISHPLPENAMWRKVFLRGGSVNKTKEYTQARNIMEQPLCKLCQEPCLGPLAKEPEYFEDLFCGFNCFEEYRIRTSQRALREALFKVEGGVCTLCKLDCHKLVKCIRPLSIRGRREFIHKTAPNLLNSKNLVNKLIFEPVEGNAWHADHVIPVYKGGGECRLENMRTLCVACHSKVTAAQRVERRLARSEAKKQLKSIMRELEAADEFSDANNDIEDDALLIKVPGSAYSVDNTASEDDKSPKVLQPGDQNKLTGLVESAYVTQNSQHNPHASSACDQKKIFEFVDRAPESQATIEFDDGWWMSKWTRKRMAKPRN
ncbi:uncharacterized protein LOC116257565 isoform X4 [Nymphaea colorata]|uniref:uncharacterized protein LOC116257565 isoform X4 n=1 Tax=Nymphaea colorata TaxID=210225 RepID=UPI00129DFA81|nr:uncharacterized protein LOC116257565 isoform X4 [Nymphaea colorata]